MLVGARVEDHDARAEVGEADAAALEHDVVLGHASAEPHAARRPADGVLDDVRRELDRLGLAVDAAAAVGEHVERVVALHEHAGVLEHLERRSMDVVEVRFAEDLETRAGVALRPRLRIAFHRLTPFPGRSDWFDCICRRPPATPRGRPRLARRLKTLDGMPIGVVGVVCGSPCLVAGKGRSCGGTADAVAHRLGARRLRGGSGWPLAVPSAGRAGRRRALLALRSLEPRGARVGPPVRRPAERFLSRSRGCGRRRRRARELVPAVEQMAPLDHAPAGPGGAHARGAADRARGRRGRRLDRTLRPACSPGSASRCRGGRR